MLWAVARGRVGAQQAVAREIGGRPGEGDGEVGLVEHRRVVAGDLHEVVGVSDADRCGEWRAERRVHSVVALVQHLDGVRVVVHWRGDRGSDDLAVFHLGGRSGACRELRLHNPDVADACGPVQQRRILAVRVGGAGALERGGAVSVVLVDRDGLVREPGAVHVDDLALQADRAFNAGTVVVEVASRSEHAGGVAGDRLGPACQRIDGKEFLSGVDIAGRNHHLPAEEPERHPLVDSGRLRRRLVPGSDSRNGPGRCIGANDRAAADGRTQEVVDVAERVNGHVAHATAVDSAGVRDEPVEAVVFHRERVAVRPRVEHQVLDVVLVRGAVVQDDELAGVRVDLHATRRVVEVAVDRLACSGCLSHCWRRDLDRVGLALLPRPVVRRRAPVNPHGVREAVVGEGGR